LQSNISNQSDNGRLHKETSKLDQPYEISRTFDSSSRVSTLTYPGGLKVTQSYTAKGYLQQVSNSSNATVYCTNQ
jgi:hypothetical protein